jgi:hypothetical protein
MTAKKALSCSSIFSLLLHQQQAREVPWLHRHADNRNHNMADDILARQELERQEDIDNSADKVGLVVLFTGQSKPTPKTIVGVGERVHGRYEQRGDRSPFRFALTT